MILETSDNRDPGQGIVPDPLLTECRGLYFLFWRKKQDEVSQVHPLDTQVRLYSQK